MHTLSRRISQRSSWLPWRIWFELHVPDNRMKPAGLSPAALSSMEVGANDFQLSDMGPGGDPIYIATPPALAHNSLNHEYLVVWIGDDNTPPLVDNEYEVFGQRFTSSSGRIYLPLVIR